MNRLKLVARFAVLAAVAAAVVALPVYLMAGSTFAQGEETPGDDTAGHELTLRRDIISRQLTPGQGVGMVSLPSSLDDTDVTRPRTNIESFTITLDSAFERWELHRTVFLDDDTSGSEVISRGEGGVLLAVAFDRSIVPGFDYEWVVVAYLPNGDSATSNVESLSSASYRDALSGIPVASGVKLIIAPGPSNATGQIVYRYDPTVETETPSFEVVTLTSDDIDDTTVDGSYYMYAVEYTAPDAVGTGVEVVGTTNTVVVKAGGDGRPGYIWDVQLQSDADTGIITATWDPPRKNAGSLAFYEVRRRVTSPRGEWQMIGLQRSRTFEDSNVEIDVFYDYEIWGRDFLGRRSFLTSFIQKEKVYTVPTCTTDLYDGAFEVSKHDGTNPITGYTIQSGSWLAPAHREERSDGVFLVNPHAVQGLMLGTFDSNATFWVGDREPPCEGGIDLDDFEVERSLLYKYVEHSSCGEQEWCAVIGGDSGVAPTPVIVEPTHRVLVDDQRYVFITADPEYPEPGVYSYGYRVCTTASGDDKVCSAQVTPRTAMHQYP